MRDCASWFSVSSPWPTPAKPHAETRSLIQTLARG